VTRDRLAGLVLCLASIVLLMSAWQIRRVIPIGIGPGTFPIILASLLGMMGFVLLLRRSVPRDPSEDPSVVQTLAGMSAYVVLAVFTLLALEPAGFILTGTILIIATGWKLGARWVPLLATASLAPAIIHFLFVRAFSVPLPAGILDGVLN
jgi:putative tricarboxylic transport membrane protein